MKKAVKDKEENLVLSLDKVAKLGKALPMGSIPKIAKKTGLTQWRVRTALNPVVTLDPVVIKEAIDIYNASSLTGQISITDLQ